jgi:hypothetical protein
MTLDTFRIENHTTAKSPTDKSESDGFVTPTRLSVEAYWRRDSSRSRTLSCCLQGGLLTLLSIDRPKPKFGTIRKLPRQVDNS